MKQHGPPTAIVCVQRQRTTRNLGVPDAFAGSPERFAAQVRRGFDSGATRIEFGRPFGIEADKGLRLLAERVMPSVR